MLTISFIIGVLLISPLCRSQEKSFVIEGSLVGSDGKPLQVADVHLLSNAPRTPRFLLQTTSISNDGEFQLTFSKSGLYRLSFTGVNHYELEAPLLIEEPGPIFLSIQLRAYEPPDSISRVRMIGDFNNFSTSKGAINMERRDDGSYVATVETNADTVAYQLLGVEKTHRSINGTQSDYYVYDGGGDYRSVIRTKKGPTTVTFNPHLLKRSASSPLVKFRDEKSLAARFYQLHFNLERRRERLDSAIGAHMTSGKPSNEFKYDWSNDLSEIKHAREREHDPTLKEAWLLAAIEFGGLQSDSALASEAISQISPVSPLWSYRPDLLDKCISNSKARQGYLPYLQRVIDNHSDREIKPYFIGALLDIAKALGDTALLPKYFQMLVTDFDKSPWTEMAKTRYAARRAIQVGKNVPDFSVKSLEDTNVVYTNKKLLGTVYLIDFWAVWCAPCVGEMKYLHEAFDKFKSKGLTILSASHDFKRADVVKFRKEKWPMPWLHTFVTNGPDNEFSKAFEVLSMPKPVLVGRDGKILAAEEELRGERLMSTLSKVFGE